MKEEFQGQCTGEIRFEELKIEDYQEIYDLWSKTPGVGLSKADSYDNIQRFLLRNEGMSFVCRYGDKIIATILCGHDGRRGFIYHLAVEEGYRRWGIGGTLVEKCLQKLKEVGIDKCHIFVYLKNEPGNAFWSAKGWMKRDDLFVYTKSLDEGAL